MKSIIPSIALAICMLFPLCSNAQEYGVKAGTLLSRNMNILGSSQHLKLGWQLGAYISTTKPLNNFHLELQASKKAFGVNDVLLLNLYYSELAFLYKRRLSAKVHFLGGGQLGLFMGGDFRSKKKIDGLYPIEQTIISTYKLDIAMPIGLLFDFKNIKLAINGTLALINRQDNFQNISLGFALYYTGYGRYY